MSCSRERPTNQADVAEDEVLCHCSGTRRGYIRSLFEQGKDMAAISRWTGALSGCGGCEWDIADFLKTLAEQEAARQETSSD
ncbi:MAG: (2Fe-2S)-binding protein [Sideroxydans sp.]|nr:(2Fe-2S)-binding protein [Sideroxydans sp.]